MRGNEGFTMVGLLAALAILAIGLLVAVPVWKTQIRREAEEELIFRGRQYVEAIRLYQRKNPGQFPKSIQELVKKRYLRRPFPDPMTKSGKWDVILQQDRLSRSSLSSAPAGTQTSLSVQLLLVSEGGLAAIGNPRILGVVSSSTEKSFRLYDGEDSYDKWYFYYGQDAKAKPEVVRYGQETKK